jgi:hypothetical protein
MFDPVKIGSFCTVGVGVWNLSDCVMVCVWCVYGVMSLSLVTVLWCCMVCLWCDEFKFSD